MQASSGLSCSAPLVPLTLSVLRAGFSHCGRQRDYAPSCPWDEGPGEGISGLSDVHRPPLQFRKLIRKLVAEFQLGAFGTGWLRCVHGQLALLRDTHVGVATCSAGHPGLCLPQGGIPFLLGRQGRILWLTGCWPLQPAALQGSAPRCLLQLSQQSGHLCPPLPWELCPSVLPRGWLSASPSLLEPQSS